MNPLLPAIISGIVESIVGASVPTPPQAYAPAGIVRPALQSGPLAVMGPPANGYAQFDDRQLRLAANLMIRDTQNRIVMPISITGPVPVLYKVDADGSVQRVWVLTPEEVDIARQVLQQKSVSPQ